MNYSLRDFREKADELVSEKISSREKLAAALPILIGAQNRLAFMKALMSETAASIKQLSEACSEYAIQHPTVFDGKKLDVSAAGVMSGDVTALGITYHLASGYSSPERTDGGKLTQDFLEDLPKDWTKASLKLDTTAINRAGITEEQLDAEGLFRPAKNVWSVPKASVEDGDDSGES